MTKTTKTILIVAAVLVALVVLFNFLPGGVRIASTISAGVGFVAGIVAKVRNGRETPKMEAVVCSSSWPTYTAR